MSIWAPTNARSTGLADHPQTVADLVEDRLAFGVGRWRRFGRADRQQEDGGDQVGDRVDDDRDRAGQELDEEARDAEPGELRNRAAGGQGAVRLDQPLSLHDRREVRVVGGVEERRQHGGETRDRDELP